MGLLYFWIAGLGRNASWGSQFVLLHGSPAECSTLEPNQVTVLLEAPAKFPCSGILTGSQEGFITAPSIQLAVPEGRDVVLMLAYPRSAPHGVSVDKTVLTIPGEDATATLSTENGELRCLGTVQGPGHCFKDARIIVNRNPGLPVSTGGFNETLCELKQPGAIDAVWKPVTRNFERCLLAFHPPSLSAFSMSSFFPTIDDLGEHFGAPEDDYSGICQITWWGTVLA
jgi:hypothetical protein